MTVSRSSSSCPARGAAGLPRKGRGAIVAVLLVAALAATVLPVRAAITCTATVTGMVFGSYDVFSNTPLDGTGNLQIACSGNPSYTAAISTGGSGSYTPRVMKSGSHTLNYNLYTDAARTTVWGNGVSGTATVSANTAKPVNDAPIYGRIPALQKAWVGSYTDTVTLTVTY